MNSSLTEKEKKWILKGKVIELFEEFEELQNKYKRLTSELKAYRPSYHDIKTVHTKGYFVQKSINSYKLIDGTMTEINATVAKIQEIDDEIEKLRDEYIKIFKTDIPYQKLICHLKDNTKEQSEKWRI